MNLALKLGMAGLVVTGAAFGATYAMQALFIDALDRCVEEKTGLQAHFAKADLGFWPALHFSGDDLRLTDANANRDPVLRVERVGFDLNWSGLFSGKPSIANLTLTHPRLNIIEGETEKLAPAIPENNMSHVFETATIDAVTIDDGTLTVQNVPRNAKASIDGINLLITADKAGPLNLSGDGRFGMHTITFKAEAHSFKALAEGLPTALSTEIAIAELSASPLTAQSTIQLNDHALRFDGGPQQLAANQVKVTGLLDWSKDVPFLSLVVTGNELNIAATSLKAQPLQNVPDRLDDARDQPLGLSAARLIDASAEVTIKTLKAGAVKAQAVQAKASLTNGLFKSALQSGSFYQGALQADLSVDGNEPVPVEKLIVTLTNIDAAPFVAGLANFNHLEGKFDMNVALQTTGLSSRAMAAGLAGTSTLHFHDGAIVNIDAPSTLRAILAYMPPAWRSLSDRIAISSLDGSFAINQGMATTDSLHLMSPIIDARGRGSISLADQSFDLRFEPKVAAQPAKPQTAPNGGKQTSAPAPLDLGAAILVQGPWSDPQVSADLSGLLNNPQGAMDTLGALGQQFLGGDSGASGTQPIPNEEIMKGVGELLGGLLGGMPDPASSNNPAVKHNGKTLDPRTGRFRDGY